MLRNSSDLIRLVLVGAPDGELRLAAQMAHEAGAEVIMVDDAEAALDRLRGEGCDLAMIDVSLDAPAFMKQLRVERIGVPVLACGIHAPAERAVAAIQAGALDYIPLPPQRELIAAAILMIGRRVSYPVGEDAALRQVIEYARSVAPSPAPMLITGEPGTGKEVLARLVHDASGRHGRFVVVECAGVAPEIVESQLFGHDAGAFPGALASRRGALHEAIGGTVFLREVGALPPATQARLATVLNECTNGAWIQDANPRLTVRLIASSSRDLSAQVSAAEFRADLLAGFSSLQIEVPPLRARGDDSERLANHFAEQLALSDGLAVRPLTSEALQRLRHHSWPGNVRELKDVIRRAILLARGAVIDGDALVLGDGSQMPGVGPANRPAIEPYVDPLVGRSMADVERELILQTLKRCGGNRTSASTILGISVRTMRNKLKSFIEAGIPISPAA